jgi:hypothetical protein
MSQANLSQELAEQVYGLPTGGVASGAARNGDKQLVVAVKEIKPADDSQNAQARTQISNFLAQSMSNDLAGQFRAALLERYDVSVNDQRIDALFDEVNVRR